MATPTIVTEAVVSARTGNPGMLLLLKLLCGPVGFVLTYWLPVSGVSHDGKIIMATFIWAVVWWALQPVPWIVTSILPLIIFPVAQVMSIAEAARLYGQPIFFWLLGFSLLGHAIIEHGLAKRFAVNFLRLPGIGTSTYRMLFAFMLITGLLSWFVGHLPSILMMLPLGIALQKNLRAENSPAGEQLVDGTSWSDSQVSRNPRLANFFAIGTLYAVVAGGAATISGAPHNAVAVAQFETITGQPLGWFRWMAMGFPIFVLSLVVFYLLLMLFFKPEFKSFRSSAEVLQEERRKLGPLKIGEKYVLIIFLLGITLFVVPPVLRLILGVHHPVSLWMIKVLSIWLVPPIMMVMMFGIPTNIQKKQFLINWREGMAGAPWHIIFLVTCGVGLTDALERFGFTKIITETVLGRQVSPTLFPFFAGTASALSANFMHGVTASMLMSSILLPMSVHPAAIAIVVGATSVGVLFPWAGATVATVYSFGQISLRDLMRVGILAHILMILVAGACALLIGSFL
jgi:sodium-dependent dicarboxylate transporter 2/3/5